MIENLGADCQPRIPPPGLSKLVKKESLSRSMRRLLRLVLLTATVHGCADFTREEALEGLSVTDVVSYWSVRGKVGDDTYIRPLVRFRIRNDSERDVDYVQTMAVFRWEKAPDEGWGNAFEYSLSGDPVSPGEVSRMITLRSDSYYFSKEEPEEMFESAEWQQVTVEVYAKAGRSTWKSVVKLEVPKQIGAPGVNKFLDPDGEPGEPEQ
jgi:hypothetical protein